jgi:hypothetical protein
MRRCCACKQHHHQCYYQHGKSREAAPKSAIPKPPVVSLLTLLCLQASVGSECQYSPRPTQHTAFRASLSAAGCAAAVPASKCESFRLLLTHVSEAFARLAALSLQLSAAG